MRTRAKDATGAAAALEEAAKAHPADGRVLLELGKLYAEGKEYDKAAATFEAGRAAAPAEGEWLDQLARVYDLAKKPDRLAAILEEQTGTNADDLALHLRLAKLHANANRPTDAERAARRALHIDVLSAEARELLFAALAAQGKEKELGELRKRFE